MPVSIIRFLSDGIMPKSSVYHLSAALNYFYMARYHGPFKKLFFVFSVSAVFAYLSGIYKACSDNIFQVSMKVNNKNLSMTLTCFSVACHDSDSSHTFQYVQFECYQGGFIVPMSTGIWSDLDIIGQYEVILRAGFDSVLSILSLRRSSYVDRNMYVDVEPPFLGYIFDTGKVSSLLLSPVSKCQRSGSKELVVVSVVMWYGCCGFRMYRWSVVAFVCVDGVLWRGVACC